MFRFADNNTAPLVRRMWKICFNDSEEYMNLYFRHKYRNENTLLCFEGNTPTASLQMLPYRMRISGLPTPVAYISGACTLPEYRGKGYMKSLLEAAHKAMRERKIPLSLLVPANEKLYGFYARCGYEKVFDKGDTPIDLNAFLPYYPHAMERAFALFDKTYQQRDFCVLKTEDDFRVIMDEWIMSGCPPKYNLAGMARIIDAQALPNPDNCLLAAQFFDGHHPVMNLMLE
ncbi:MAG: GNAT family N-acetyltransferase [Prevotella sp.]|jgi:predicted acetyltransferase|nr:GNAT family N-acetyltransferase [Prevotella sp.]